jgi:Big-like domain-containing protein
VPDVALHASFANDGYLICSEGSCTNGFRRADQTLDVIGGTSAGAPSMAGILGVIVGGTGASGLGSANPTLYSLAGSVPSAFHDVTSGNNEVPCQPGSPNCPAVAPFQFGFTATAGYDRATGLGSVDADVLATHWAPTVSTSTSLALSSPSTSVGASETFTATVTPAASGFGSPLGGRVQFSIDGSAAGAPVPVAKTSGSYRAVFSTSSLTGGNHAIQAAYGGNLVYLASASGPSAVNVTDFSFDATPLSPVTAGGSATSTLTISALDGFAGTVALSCAPDPKAKIQCQIQPSSVMLSAGSPTQTATLTVTTAPRPATMAGMDSLGPVFLALAIAGLPRPRRRRFALALVLFLVSSTSCGGGGGGGGSGAAQVSAKAGTPAGNYSIGLTASSGPASHSVSVPLTVQ